MSALSRPEPVGCVVGPSTVKTFLSPTLGPPGPAKGTTMSSSISRRTVIAGGLATAAVIGAFGTPIQYSLTPVLLAFGCAFGTGLVFGYLPAQKAARLDPVVALAAE